MWTFALVSLIGVTKKSRSQQQQQQQTHPNATTGFKFSSPNSNASGAGTTEVFLLRKASYWTIIKTRWCWAQCTWCWRWEYNMGIPDGFNGPLCRRCMELEEPPWWPNHRQRCELFVWHWFGRDRKILKLQAFPWDVFRTIASFLSEPWLP